MGKDGFAIPIPRAYWDAGHSLHELVSFVRRQSSFDPKTLKMATVEQLGTLMGDEDAARLQYEVEDRWARRNEGRDILPNPFYDWVAGEVLFDGKRWHVAVGGASLFLALLSLTYILFIKNNVAANSHSSSPGSKKKAH